MLALGARSAQALSVGRMVTARQGWPDGVPLIREAPSVSVRGSREPGRPAHGSAFLLGGSAPDSSLPGGQGVRHARGAYRTPEAHRLSGEDLRERRPGGGDGKEQLGILTVAGTPWHPARGAACEL
jgi:hypothetical protein